MTEKPDSDPARAAEAALHAAGIHDARVHAHGDVARVELGDDALERLMAAGEREVAIAAVRAAGFRFVSIDLAALDAR